MRAIVLCESPDKIKEVFKKEHLETIRKLGWNGNILTSSTLEENKQLLADTQYIFSTWGMPRLDKKTIKTLFPSLKAVLYAAGSVQDFAKEYLMLNISVCSAWAANGVPVAEYAFSQITLAAKGFFMAEKICRFSYSAAREYSECFTGNYDVTVGLIGLGMIGSLVANRLKNIKAEVIAYDPFCTSERAESLNVKLVKLEEIFKKSDVISNHMADKADTKNVLNYVLFKKMKPYAAFINTARGAQVVEDDLIKAMSECPTRVALLDVTYPEPYIKDSLIAKTPNIIITPHIAGSMGNERFRMADYMMDELKRLENNLPPLFSVTLAMLDTMA